MAIYHFNVSIVSRNKGQSSVFVAARHACEKLYDSRLGLTVSNLQKHNLIFKEILLTKDAPLWMGDREKLWNAVEKAENRKDSQLAREIGFSLPCELTDKQNIELAKGFVEDEFVARGMVADLCIHVGEDKNNDEMSHAHVMLTMRVVTANGFGLKERGWNGRENIMLWRESWAKYANRCLALNGVGQRIDHRSYEELGIDLIPQKKRGYKNSGIGKQKIEEHRIIAKENGERILKNPSIAFKAITNQQDLFTYQELAKFVKRHTADSNQFKVVYEKLKSSKHIISLGKGKNGL